MGFAHKAIVAGAAGVAAAVIVGCGSSGALLSQSQANNLNTQLNSVSEALNEHDCTAALNDLSRFESTLSNMGRVDSTLMSNLTQGANTIQDLTNDECAAQTTTKPSSPKTITTATNTDTVTTATNTDTITTATTQTTATSPDYYPGTDTTGGASPAPDTDTTGTPPVGSGGSGLGSDTTTTPESTPTTTPAGSETPTTPTTPTTPATPPPAGNSTPYSGGGGF